VSAYLTFVRVDSADNIALANDADLKEAAGPEAMDNAAHVIHDASGIHRGDSRDEKV
jgi:hypothetical protein